MSGSPVDGPLWRVGYHRAPVDFTPLDLYGFSHRFDDVDQRFRTLYVAEFEVTSLREVLADFRPNLAARQRHIERYGPEAADDFPLAPVTAKWTTHDWDMLRARSVIKQGIGSITDTVHRADVETVMAWYDTVEPLFADLPRSVTHQDLNGSNVLATTDESGRQRITGVLDINDSLFTIRVAELAVAAAYAILRKADPLNAIATVVAGFNSVTPLTDHELAVVFPSPPHGWR